MVPFRTIPVLAAAVALWMSLPARAQVMRLPPTDVGLESFPVRAAATLPGEPSPVPSPIPTPQLQPAYPPCAPGPAAIPRQQPYWPQGPSCQVQPGFPPDVWIDPDTPRDARQTFFQKLLFDETWLARLGSGGFGTDDVQLRTVLAMPFPTRRAPLVITPGFAAHFLDGPAGVDVPPRVYDAYAEFAWLPWITNRLRGDLTVTPGVYSDFAGDHSKAFRPTGHGAAFYTLTPSLRVVMGAAYLNRKGVEVLPIAGITWHPSEDSRFDLVFPKPKIARRLAGSFNRPGDVEWWAYVSGELGGGSWAFEQTSGGEDVFNYSDYRVMLGIEWKTFAGLSGRIETGYVFGRKIEFDSGLPTVFPSDTVMLRGALSY
jgi:hypothetical protein